MSITREQYSEWLFNPTTIEIREKMRNQRVAWQEILSLGETLKESPGYTAMETAKMVGKIEGIDTFLNLHYPKKETINKEDD